MMKPCPFCGGTDIQDLYLEDNWLCSWCASCAACGPAKQSEEEAQLAWNDRSRFDNAIHSMLIKQVTEARDLLTDLIGDDDWESPELSRDD